MFYYSSPPPPPPSPLPFSLPSVMGACLSNEKLPDNIFVVRNIHDDNRKFPKGIIEVTQVELKYKDAQSGDEWVWPLKYLRKYGCDRDIFSFEAGRKCPGGEGLYAFSTKKASQLFDMVARNISEGGLERDEVGVLSPQDTSQGVSPPIMTSSSVISTPNPPPPPPVTNPPSHLPPSATPRQPEYTNLSYHDGQQVLALAATTNGHAASTTPPPHLPVLQRDRLPTDQETPSPPLKLNYTEVALPETSRSSLEIESKETEKRVSYSEIDIKQTEEYKQKKALEQAKNQRPLPNMGTGEFKIVTPTDAGPHSRKSSRPPSASSTGSTVTPLSTTAQRSMSEGNFSSQHNGVIPGRPHSNSSSSVLDASGAPTLLYQNITMSRSNVAPQTIPEDSETILHSSPASPHVQPNYMNIKPNSALGSSGGGRRGTDPEVYHREREPRLGLMRHDSDVQATYQNLRIGMGTVSPPMDPVVYHREREPRLGLMRYVQATDQNLRVGMGTVSPPMVSDSSSYLSASPPRVSGPKMGIYAQLDLSGPVTSTPKGKGGNGNERKRSSEDDENHMTLNFSGVTPPPNKTPEPMETSRTRHSPPPTQIQLPEVRRSSTEVSRPGAAAVIQDRPDDGTTVNYSTMNFDAIRALKLTKEQREQEIKERLEEEAREEERKKREEAENPGKKKKKNKKKKKDRRNSHQ